MFELRQIDKLSVTDKEYRSWLEISGKVRENVVFDVLNSKY